MGVDGELREAMIDIYEDHKHCDWNSHSTNSDCSAGWDFMEFMQVWMSK